MGLTAVWCTKVWPSFTHWLVEMMTACRSSLNSTTLLKLAHICKSYCKYKRGTFLWTTVYMSASHGEASGPPQSIS